MAPIGAALGIRAGLPCPALLLDLGTIPLIVVDDSEFRHVCDDPFLYDVQKRVPDTRKAKEILGFEATTPLEDMLDEVIPWIDEQIKLGTI